MHYNAHLAVYHSQKPIKGELHIVIENYLSHKRLESFLSLILDIFQYLTLFFFFLNRAHTIRSSPIQAFSSLGMSPVGRVIPQYI